VQAGFLYLAVVLDTFSRRIVGWAMETHLRSELVLQALNLALGSAAVIHHSDQDDSQYTSLACGQRCRAAGVRPSMGALGDCFDYRSPINYERNHLQEALYRSPTPSTGSG
jgi:putative transposase